MPAFDAICLIISTYEMVDRIVVLDVHVSQIPKEQFLFDTGEYWCATYREYPDDDTSEAMSKAPRASADNSTRFWFTRPSLVNILNRAGFSSIYECFNPIHLIPEHLNFEKSGIAHRDRGTFVVLKGEVCEIITSPIANDIQRAWLENSLSNFPASAIQGQSTPLYRRILSKLRRIRF